jgi:hypothetical protein
MSYLRVALAFSLVACTSETTSFRTTDRGDGSEPGGRPAAAYEVTAAGAPVARIHVWSNGGYIGSSDEPMTHVGFEVDNVGARPIVFDADALRLVVFDARGATVPGTTFTAVTPLGPSLVVVAPGEVTSFDAYFRLEVRPRVVESMRVRWALRVGGEAMTFHTRFVRDD